MKKRIRLGERGCLTHVGAPENRIDRWKSNVLTPRGNDMIPVLGLEVSRRSPDTSCIIYSFFCLLFCPEKARYKNFPWHPVLYRRI